MDEAQTGIKTAGRNINNLRYAYDTTLMAESEEELKSLLMKVKEESEKVESDQQLKNKMTARVTLSVIFPTEKKHRLIVASGIQNIVSVETQAYGGFRKSKHSFCKERQVRKSHMGRGG